MIGQTVSHYRIIEKLGEGGMGVVYLAEDLHLGRRVAVKFLSDSTSNTHHFKARFLREARAASGLSHPHIATVYDYGETDDGHPFIVMEQVKGQPLSDLLYDGVLTLARALEIIEEVAAALGEAHRHGIIHRDIKPSNVLINDRNEVKVLDFGLAKRLNDETSQSDPNARTLLAVHTRSDVVVGTPLYLSPEQAKGINIDARSDLFALGALLYECLTGRAAFSGSGVLEIAAQVIHVTPAVPSSINRRVPKELDRVVMKALEKEPDKRYQSADELIKDLRSVRAGLSNGLSSNGQRILPRVEGQSSFLTSITSSLRRPRLPLGLLIIALLAAGLLVWTILRWRQPEAQKISAEGKQWYDRGLEALRSGAYHRASKSLEKAIEIDDKYALSHARLAEAWVEMGYIDKAKDEMLRVSSLVPDRSVLTDAEALSVDAINALVSNDYTRAIKSYEQLAALAPDEAQSYVDLARALEKNGELSKAIEKYVQATNLDSQNAIAHLRLGALYGRQQNMTGALASFQRAESLYEPSGNTEGRTAVLLERGVVLIEAGKLPEAESNLEKALGLASASGNDSQKISALLQLSRRFFKEGEIGKGQDFANQAVNFARERGLDDLIASGLRSLGYTFLISGNYSEAEKTFNRAMEFAKKNKSRLREAEILQNLASLYIQQLRTEDALAYARRALAFFEQGGYRSNIYTCLTLIARAYRRKGDYDESLKAFQQTLEHAEQSGYQPQIAFTHGEIAMVLATQERYPEALARFEQSYELHKTLNDRRNMAYSLMNRGNVLWRLGRYSEARASLAQAAEMASQPDNHIKPVLAEVALRLAEIALSEKRFGEAKTRSEEALSLAETQYKETRVQAKYTLGQALAFSGQAGEAKRLCQEAVEMAKTAGDATLLSRALLALAEVLIESKELEQSLMLAQQAQSSFSHGRQMESEWRAWLAMARASRLKRDEPGAGEQAARANQTLAQLRQKWGEEVFKTYLARPDIEFSHKQLGDAAVPVAVK